MTSRSPSSRELVGRGKGAAAALQVGEDAVAALGVQGFEVLAKKTLIIHFDLPDALSRLLVSASLSKPLSPKGGLSLNRRSFSRHGF